MVSYWSQYSPINYNVIMVTQRLLHDGIYTGKLLSH